MRSGTLSPALCVGLGAACKICYDEMQKENNRLSKLRDMFYNGITKSVRMFISMVHPNIEFLVILI